MQYTKREEVINAVTHGLGVLLAVAGTAVMAVFASRLGSAAALSSSLIYGLSLIVLYLMSTLYHSVSHERAKPILRKFDHASIFLLIAGTYTPITLIVLGGTPKALALLIGVWAAAIVGIVLNFVDMARFRRASMVLYVLMGWAVLLDIRTTVNQLGPAGIALLLGGGLSYTVGIVFYKLKKVRYMHGVWHLFVLGGSILHYLCILRHIGLM